LDDLEAFLLELGRDFCFVERQMRITVAGRHHFLDLLFFHRELRCMNRRTLAATRQQIRFGERKATFFVSKINVITV
jgi:predicted nuclease of restriction endonuclease-like (RecB) superfamily